MVDAHAEAGDGDKAAAWLQRAVDAGPAGAKGLGVLRLWGS